jgi:hypothetical protein
VTRTLAAALAASLVASVALAAVTSDDVKKRLESVYPVQVLGVEPTEIDGKPAFLVRVMNKAPGGNDAFAVTILAVDADTGELISAFRHRSSGYALSDDFAREPKEINVPEQGMKTWR